MMHGRKGVKTLVRALVRVLFDRRPVPTPCATPRHVVVLRWDAKLGDAIVSSPFYREIRKLQGVRVTVVTVAELAALHQDDFGVDRVIVTRAHPGLRELLRIRRKLGAVDAVVHLVGRVQPHEIVFLSRLKPARIYSLDGSLRLVTHKLDADSEGRRFTDHYVHVLESLGVANADASYIVPVLAEPEAKRMETADIVFNPYGSRPDKWLPPGKAAELLLALAEAFPHVRIGILSSPPTHAAALQLACRAQRPNIKVVNGIDTARHAATVLQTAGVVLSVDTAIVHMAVGLGKKLVAIYADTGAEWNPWLPPPSPATRVVISRQDIDDYERTGRKDMSRFSSATVIQAVRDLGLSASADRGLITLDARVIRGLGAASGTLSRQLPLIGAGFPEVAACHPGTLNLQLTCALSVREPDYRSPPLAWTPSRRTREVFDLVRLELELVASGRRFPAWLYVAHGSPHRATPRIHELIAARIDLAGETACRLHIRSSAIHVGTPETACAV